MTRVCIIGDVQMTHGGQRSSTPLTWRSSAAINLAAPPSITNHVSPLSSVTSNTLLSSHQLQSGLEAETIPTATQIQDLFKQIH